MPATRDEVIAALGAANDEVERLVSAAGQDAWSNHAYERWTAKHLLAHVASTSGVAGFVLIMARNPGLHMGAGAPSRSGGGLDQDAWNAQQVSMREGRTPEEMLDEVRGNIGRDLKALEAAPDDLLSGHFRAPWDIEGTVGDVIVGSIHEHLMMHLRDLAAALA